MNHMGNALTVVNAARVSFASQSIVLSDKDKKLIKYLAVHKHLSPFEHLTLTVKVTVPLYIRSQIMRHRTFAYNEISRRYTNKNMNFYLPKELRKQHESNRQASSSALTDQSLLDEIDLHQDRCLVLYEKLIAAGVCKEQARGVLSQDLLTEFYMTGNLRNWAHFISLRKHEGAQAEIQEISKMIEVILVEKFEYAAEVLLK